MLATANKLTTASEALLRSLLADFIRRSPLQRAKLSFASTADFIRSSPLQRAKPSFANTADFIRSSPLQRAKLSFASTADFIRSSPLQRAKLSFASTADFVRRSSLQRAKAEREGFKPPVPVTVHLISNQAHSITLTPLRIKWAANIKI